MSDAARRLAKAHIIAYCMWDGADEDTRPKLHKAAALSLTVDFVSSRPGVVVDLEPDFAIALQIAIESGHTRPPEHRSRPPKGSLCQKKNLL